MGPSLLDSKVQLKGLINRNDPLYCPLGNSDIQYRTFKTSRGVFSIGDFIILKTTYKSCKFAQILGIFKSGNKVYAYVTLFLTATDIIKLPHRIIYPPSCPPLTDKELIADRRISDLEQVDVLHIDKIILVKNISEKEDPNDKKYLKYYCVRYGIKVKNNLAFLKQIKIFTGDIEEKVSVNSFTAGLHQAKTSTQKVNNTEEPVASTSGTQKTRNFEAINLSCESTKESSDSEEDNKRVKIKKKRSSFIRSSQLSHSIEEVSLSSDEEVVRPPQKNTLRPFREDLNDYVANILEQRRTNTETQQSTQTRRRKLGDFKKSVTPVVSKMKRSERRQSQVAMEDDSKKKKKSHTGLNGSFWTSQLTTRSPEKSPVRMKLTRNRTSFSGFSQSDNNTPMEMLPTQRKSNFVSNAVQVSDDEDSPFMDESFDEIIEEIKQKKANKMLTSDSDTTIIYEPPPIPVTAPPKVPSIYYDIQSSFTKSSQRVNINRLSPRKLAKTNQDLPSTSTQSPNDISLTSRHSPRKIAKTGQDLTSKSTQSPIKANDIPLRQSPRKPAKICQDLLSTSTQRRISENEPSTSTQRNVEESQDLPSASTQSQKLVNPYVKLVREQFKVPETRTVISETEEDEADDIVGLNGKNSSAESSSENESPSKKLPQHWKECSQKMQKPQIVNKSTKFINCSFDDDDDVEEVTITSPIHPARKSASIICSPVPKNHTSTLPNVSPAKMFAEASPVNIPSTSQDDDDDDDDDDEIPAVDVNRVTRVTRQLFRAQQSKSADTTVNNDPTPEPNNDDNNEKDNDTEHNDEEEETDISPIDKLINKNLAKRHSSASNSDASFSDCSPSGRKLMRNDQENIDTRENIAELFKVPDTVTQKRKYVRKKSYASSSEESMDCVNVDNMKTLGCKLDLSNLRGNKSKQKPLNKNSNNKHPNVKKSKDSSPNVSNITNGRRSLKSKEEISALLDDEAGPSTSSAKTTRCVDDKVVAGPSTSSARATRRVDDEVVAGPSTSSTRTARRSNIKRPVQERSVSPEVKKKAKATKECDKTNSHSTQRKAAPSPRPSSIEQRSQKNKKISSSPEVIRKSSRTPQRKRNVLSDTDDSEYEVSKKKTTSTKKGTPKAKITNNKQKKPVNDAIIGTAQELPGRENEMMNIKSFIVRKLEERFGGCMYINGVPGTGKTASVTQVLLQLRELVDDGVLADFKLVQVSGMELTQPQQVYSKMVYKMFDTKMSPAVAQNYLNEYFCKTDKKKMATVLIIDELDMLCNKRQDVVYTLFDWPSKAESRLIVLAIANTFDLPDRLLKGKVTSRMGLTRIVFHPYSYEQLLKIVSVKLSNANNFTEHALGYIARKVAAVSGDVRRAMDFCRRALDIAGDKNVGMQHVQKVFEEMLSSPSAKAVKNCSTLAKHMLNCMLSEMKRTGLEETTLQNVLNAMNESATFLDISKCNFTQACEIVAQLANCRLILAEENETGTLGQRLSLGISKDDIYLAINDNENS